MVTFQFYAGQFDGLNQTLTLSGLQKAYKNFQLNLGSGQAHKSIWISIEVKYQVADGVFFVKGPPGPLAIQKSDNSYFLKKK